MTAANINSAPFYWGRLSRDEAETKLAEVGSRDGSYLLRLTWTRTGREIYVISLSFENDFFHYEIKKLEDGTYCIPPGSSFIGVVEIVWHHKDRADGMKCALRESIDRPRGISPTVYWGVTHQQMRDLLREKFNERRLSHDEFMGVRNQLIREVMVDLEKLQPWYHDLISRDEAIARLNGHIAGTFVVRRRQDRENYCLSVLKFPGSADTYQRSQAGGAEHYIIRKHNDRFIIDGGPSFGTLLELVDYYHCRADRIAAPLRYPAPLPPVLDDEPETPPPLEEPEDPLEEEPALLHDKKYRIDPSQLQLGSTAIGRGQFGLVYRGTLNRHGHVVGVAVKSLKSVEQDTASKLIDEAEVMIHLEHPHIVCVYGLCYNNSILLVMEYVPLGPMHHYLRDHQNQVSIAQVCVLVQQICSAMRYIEAEKLIHRDLAARNILLASTSCAKISDFGMSKALGVDTEYYRARNIGKWPLKWYPPEAYQYYTFDAKTDIWSFGVTMWEAFAYGDRPYKGRTMTDVFQLLNKGQRLDRPPRCPSSYYSIMLDCWQWRKEDRPTFEALESQLQIVLSGQTSTGL